MDCLDERLWLIPLAVSLLVGGELTAGCLRPSLGEACDEPSDCFRGERCVDPPGGTCVSGEGDDGDTAARDTGDQTDDGGGGEEDTTDSDTGTVPSDVDGGPDDVSDGDTESPPGDADDVDGDEVDDVDVGPPEDAIDLCDEGLSDGQTINPHLDEHLDSGETVLVCPGSYVIEQIIFEGEDWTLIAPEGATLRVVGNTTVGFEGSGYRVSGFVFDQTDPGAVAGVYFVGNDWRADHLGFEGESSGASYQIAAAVTEREATGVLDTIYMGDGQVAETPKGGIFAASDHNGELTIKRVYVAHMINHGISAVGPASRGESGRTNVEESYFWSNTIANVNVGVIEGRTSHVTNSVIVADRTAQPCGDGCTSPGSTISRGVWVRDGTVQVENNLVCVTGGQPDLVSDQDAMIEGSDNRVECPTDLAPPASPNPPDGVPTTLQEIFDSPPGF